MSTPKKIISQNGELMLSARKTAKRLGCAPDYVGKLCREGKLEGVREGNAWFVSRASIDKFEKARLEARLARSQELSEQRRQESEAYRKANGIPAATRRENKKISAMLLSKSGKINFSELTRPFAFALGGILLFGAVTFAGAGAPGFGGSFFGRTPVQELSASLAQVQSPFFGNHPFALRLGDAPSKNIFSVIAALFAPKTTAPIAQHVPVAVPSDTPTTTPSKPVAEAPAPVKNPSGGVVNNTYPVIERTIERTISGVSQAYLEQRVTQLDSQLRSLIFSTINEIGSFPSSGGPTNNIALTQRIDRLDGVIITNATITGSTVNGFSTFGGGGTGTIGGTGTANLFAYWSDANTLAATSSPTVGFLTATSSIASSTFAGGITVGGSIQTNIISCTEALETNASGFIVCGDDQTALGAADPFTWAPHFGVVAAATSSPFWAQNGLFASSTSRFADAFFINATTGSLTIGSLNGLLYGTNGAVGTIATSSLGLLSSTSIIAAAPLSWNSSTGALTITQSGAAADGYLSSTDWNTFNHKISSTSLSGGTGISYNSSTGVITNTGVTSLVAGNGIAVSGSTGAVTITNTIGYPFPNNATSTLLTLNAGVIAHASSTITNLTTVNATSTNATTTTFAITGISSSLLKTLTNGAVVAAIAGTDYLTSANIFAYPFPNNATTTQIAFSGGLTATNILTTGSTTLQDFTANNATTSAATTTSLAITGLSGSAGQCLTINASGSVISQTCGSGASFPFTPETNFGVNTSATSTPIWAQAGIFASSTSYFDFASSTAFTISGTGYFATASTTNLTISSIASGSLLKTTTGGSVIAAVAGTDYLTSGDVFAYPFPNNATSTTLTFNAGLVSVGSTTINGNLNVIGNATTTNATTTTFAITGISSSLLKTLTNGAVVAAIAGTDYVTGAALSAAYPFPLAGNATSTLTQFNGGLTAYASSTIGNGTQAGGLTIFGGATTTGQLHVTGTGTSTIAGGLSVSGSIVPTANNVYSLGATDKMWHSLYIGPGSLYVNGQKVISTNGGDDVVISSDPNENLVLQTSGTANIELNPAGGQVQIKNTINVTAGKSITTTDLSALSIPSGVAAGNITISGNAITASNLNGGISLTPSGSGGTYVTSGNFGIGSTTPVTTLSVNGSGYITAGLGVGVVNTNAGTLQTSGNATIGGTLRLATVSSCTGGQALQTNGSGDVACGVISVSGASSGGGWTTNSIGRVGLSTTTDLVVVGASTTPYAKFAILSGAAATTTFALVPASGQTANIIDIYNTSGVLSSVLTAGGNFGLGTTSPNWTLSVAGTGAFDSYVRASNFISTSTIASIFPYASSTAISVSGTGFFDTATTTNLNAINATIAALTTGSLTIGSLNGLLYGTNGAVGTIATSSLGLLSSTSIIAAAPLSWNSSTGALTITQSGAAADGYLSSTDWNTFNHKISSTSLSAGPGIAYNSSTGVITNTIGYPFPNNATSTLLTFSGGILATASSTFANFTANNATTSAATTTNFAILGVTNSLLKTLSDGAVVAAIAGTDYLTSANIFAYPFPDNATTTQIAFNGGLTAVGATTTSLAVTASSTIAGQLNAVGGATLGSLTAGATTLSSLTLSGVTGPLQAVDGLVSATSTLSTIYGGTGISTLPTFGQILVGNSSGTYTLTATSSLGLPTFAYPFPNNATTTQIAFSGGLTATNILTTGSTTLQDFTANFATTSQATTTSLAITGISSSLLKTLTNGAVVAAIAGTDYATPAQISNAFGFTPTTNFGATANSTSTPIWFTAGLQASSTSYFTNADFINSTTTNATTTNLFAANALITTFFGVNGTIPNFVSTNSTTTNATTTNFSATLANIGSGIFSGLVAGNSTTTNATTTNLFATNFSGTNATSTSLAITNLIPNAGLCLSVNGAGTVVTQSCQSGSGAAAFNFLSNYDQLTAATTSALWAQSGIFASSTSYFANANFINSTTTNATSTNLFASLLNATNAVVSNFTLGSLNGPLQANNGIVSATTSIGVLYGGTGLSSTPTFGQLLVGTGVGYTLSATSTLGINFADVRGIATDAQIADALTITGGSIENTPIGTSTPSTAVFTNATSTNATTTNMYINGTIAGAGLLSCSDSADKLLWSAATRQFTCGTDQAGSGSGSDNNWTFFNNSGVRLGTSTNQVLIGNALNTSTSTLSKLEVWGGATIDSATTSALHVAGNSIVGGRLGIGTTSPSQSLSIEGGNILQTTAGTLTLASSTLIGGESYSTYVAGTNLYVAAGSAGLKILSLANPASPIVLGTYSSGITSARAVVVSGKYAYLADSGFGVRIIDVSNASSPSLVGSYSIGAGSAYALAVSGSYVYVTNFNGNQVLVLDASNPAAPTLAATHATGGNPVVVAVQDKYLYIGTYSPSLRVVDISNPLNPQTVSSSYSTNMDTPTSIYVSGRYVYLTDELYGLSIVNVANPASPSLAGSFNPGGANNFNSVKVAGSYAYVTDRGNSNFIVVDLKNVAAPKNVATYAMSNAPAGVFVAGKYAYVGDESTSLASIDIHGAQLPSANIGSLAAGILNISDSLTVGGDGYIQGGLNIGLSGLFTRGGISAMGSTTLGASLTVSGTTSLQNFTARNATTTGALAVLGSGYISGTLQALNIFATGSTTLQNFTAVNATTSAATTTNLAITGISSSLLKTLTNGAVVAAVAGVDYQAAGNVGNWFIPSTFGASASNATSTLIGFNAGLYATASSTFTSNFNVLGTSYFAGSVGIGTTTPHTRLTVQGTGGIEQLTYSGPSRFSFSSSNQNHIGYAVNAFAARNSNSEDTGGYGLLGLIQDNSSLYDSWGVSGISDATNTSGTKPNNFGVMGAAYLSSTGNVTKMGGVSGYAEHRGAGTTTHMAALYGFTNVRTAGVVTNNYGLYLEGQSGIGTNNYQLYSAGTAPSYFGGNLGIGTTTPYAKLSINNSTNDTGRQALFAVASSTANSTTTLFSIDNRGSVSIEAPDAQNWITLTRAGIVRGSFNSSNSIFNISAGNNDLTLNTNSNERIRVLSTGNVGIGTTSPYSKLTTWGTGQLFEAVNNASTTIFSVGQNGATSTNLAITAVTSALLKTLPSGAVVAAIAGVDYQAAGNVGNWFIPSTFGASASNATSTLIGFNAGLYSLASSTIGNGAQNGGLTISGGATTTGNAYFAGNVGVGTTDPTSQLEIRGTSATLTLNGTVNGSKDGYSETVYKLYNPLAASPTKHIFSFGAEGNYSDAGALTNYNFYVYNPNTSRYNLTVNGNGNVYAGGSIFNAQTGVGAALTLLSGGNVGIGTTSPYAKLSVVGEVVAANFTATTTGQNTFPNLVSTNSTSTNATTTNFAITGISSSLLKTLTNGAVVAAIAGTDYVTGAGLAAAYPFPNNATSTLLTFSGGLTAAGATSTALAVTGSTTISSILDVGGSLNANGALTVLGNTSLQGATSTSFAISGISSGNLLKTTTGGAVIAAVAGVDYQAAGNVGNWFTPTTYGSSASNATSTLIGFNAGLYSLASSTIGDGEQNGGLTISGGATTTGNAYFAGNVGIRTAPQTGVALSVNGSVNIGGCGALARSGNDLQINNTSTCSSGNVNLFAGSAERARLTNTGNFALGTTSLNTARLTVAATSSASNIPLFVLQGPTPSGVATTTLFQVAANGSTTLYQIPSSLLKTDANGTIIAAVGGVDYQLPGNVGNWFTPSTFGSSASNATSTLIGFNAGLYSLASSTIGSGAQAGGLTIFGGATTTGNSYFASTLQIGKSSGQVQIKNGDTASQLDIDFPDLSTAAGNVRLFRNTNSTGNRFFTIYKGDGTNTPVFQVNATSGALTINGQLDDDNLIRLRGTGVGQRATVLWQNTAGTQTFGSISAHDENDPAHDPTNHISIETTKADLVTTVTRLSVLWGVDTSTVQISNANLNLDRNEIHSIGNLTSSMSSTTWQLVGANGVSSSTLLVSNTTNSAVDAPAIIEARVGGNTTTGNPQLRLSIANGNTWHVGVNNSNNDLFEIGTSTTIGGSGNRVLTVSTAGVVTAAYNGGSLAVGDGTNSTAYMNVSGGRTMFGYNGANAVVQGGTSKGILFNVNNASFGSGTAAAITSAGFFGVGTTSPFGLFSINPNGIGTAPAFVIGSSTQTLFSVSNMGSTTLASTFGACSGSGALTTNSSGTIVCGTVTAAGDGVGNWFTPTSYGNATSTTIGFNAGLLSVGSTTINGNLNVIGNATTTNATTTTFAISGISSALLKTLTNGAVVAAVAGVDYAAAGSGAFPFTPTTNFGALANSTSTPIWFQAGLQASSTSRFTDATFSGKIDFATSTSASSTLITLAGQRFLYADTDPDLLSNLSLGYQALNSVVPVTDTGAGTFNTAIGVRALTANSSGYSNTALGAYALTANQTGFMNTGIGLNALGSTNSGSGNVAVGQGAGFSNTTGWDNIFVGNFSSYLGPVVTGGNNIVLGSYASLPSVTSNNQLNIGGLLFGTLPATSTGFRLPTTGSIGIASTSPFAKLSIHANNGSTDTTLFAIGSSTANSTTTLFSISNTGVATFGGSTGTGDANLQFAGDDNAWSMGYVSSDKSFRIASSTDLSSNVAFSILKGGNIGIGTTTPVAQLNIYGSFDQLMLSRPDTSSYAELKFRTAGTNNWMLGTRAGGSGFHIYNDALSNTSLLVDTSGNVGIGTTSPYAKLSVVGEVVAANFTATTTGQNTFPNLVSTNSTSTNATTTNFAITGITSSLLKTLTNGAVVAAVAGVDYQAAGNVGNWFTPTTNFGALANSTSTPIWFQAGLQASSTVRFGNAGVSGQFLWDSSTGKLGLGTTSPWARLSVEANGLGTDPAFAVGSSTGTSFVVTNSGKVGIGTSTPNSMLGIASDNPGIFLHDTVGGTPIGVEILNSSLLSGFIIRDTTNSRQILNYHATANTLGTDASLILDTDTGSVPFYVSRLGNSNESLSMWVDDTTAYLLSDQDENTSGHGNLVFRTDNDSSADGYFGFQTKSGTNLMRLTSNGNLGIGTTSPWGQLSVNPNGISGPAFVIGSSTQTLFSISNMGSTTLASTFGACSGSGALTTNSSGTIVCGTVTAAGDGVGTWFTPTTNFGALANSTSTPIWFQAGLQASSTARLSDINTIGFLNFATSSSNASSTLIRFNGASLLVSSSTNTGLGRTALQNVTTGGLNTALGVQALTANTSGSGNTGLGWSALFNNTTGSNNTSIGQSALVGNTSGFSNTAVGRDTLSANTTGYQNTALGYQSLYDNQTGTNNIGLGFQAGRSISSGYANILIGAHVSTQNVITTGSGNIGLGNELYFPSATANNQLNIGGILFGTLPATTTGFLLPTTGSIGVASSSPYALLGVHANNGATYSTLFAIGSSTANSTTTLFSVDHTGRVNINVPQAQHWLALSRTGTFRGAFSSTNDVFNIVSGSNDLTFNTGGDNGAGLGTERARIANSTGFFGVGTSSPWAKLSIEASGLGASPAFAIGSSTSTRFVVTNAGNVGINTATPSNRFVAALGANEVAQLNDGTSASAIWGTNVGLISATGEAKISTRTAIPMVFYTGGTINSMTAGTERMRLMAGGGLGIGTTSPYAFLSLHAPFGFASTTLFAIASSSQGATTTLFSVSNTGRVKISAESNIINSSNEAQLEITATDTNKKLVLGYDAGANKAVIQSVNSGVNWTDLLLNRFGGNVGVGTSSAFGLFSINPDSIGSAPAFVIGSSTKTDVIVTNSGKLGIGTTTPTARLAIETKAGDLVGLAVGSSTKSLFSVSTEGFGTTTVAGLNINASATSTSNVGINITSGCFAINGVCVGGGSEGGGANTLAEGKTGTTTFYNGGVVFSDGSKLTQSSSAANFFWDELNARLGVGTSSPMSKLTVGMGSEASSFLVGRQGSSTPSFVVTGVNNNGNVGIGTSTPYARFALQGTAGDGSQLFNVSTSGGVSAFNITSGGNVGIGTSTPGAIFAITNAVSTAQQMIAYDDTTYASFLVDSVGDLTITPSGKDAIFVETNMFVCQGSACPTTTATSTAGNLFVENAVTIGSGFSVREISSTELGLYNASGGLMIIFDDGL